jgi:hypothetical protein
LWLTRPARQAEPQAADQPQEDVAQGDNQPAAAAEETPDGIRPPDLPADKVVRPLPAAVADLAVGGGGRYLVLDLPALRKLAVFDINEARIVKYLAVAEDGVKFAAGADKLFIVSSSGTVERWALGTWQREASAVVRLGGSVRHASLGSAARGPALVSWGGGDPPHGGTSHLGLLDPASLQIDQLRLPQDPHQFQPLGVRHIRAAAAGDLFGLSYQHGQGATLRLKPKGEVDFHPVPCGQGALLPAPDGSIVYTPCGLFSRTGQAIGRVQQGEMSYRLPACHGHYYLHLEMAGDRWVPTVYLRGDARPLLRLPQVEVALEPESPHGPQASGLANDRRILFIPHAKLLVTVPLTNDRLVLQRFDVEQALESSGIDYLLVTSQPPGTVKKGTTYTHRLVVKSKRGGVQCRLESGPPGMQVTPQGGITWPVPADHAAGEVDAVLCVRDRSGQELFQAIQISLLP